MGIKLFSRNVIRVLMAALISLLVVGCTPPSETKESVTVIVQGYDGALLKDATVTINEATGTTDEKGVVVLDIDTPDGDDIVVKASEDGFVNQSVIATLSEETTVLVVMHPVKEILTVANIEAQQVIEGETLGAKISLPANSLVKPDGSLAEGNVTLQLTPWDVRNNELAAMPGNGQAIDAEGNRVELISAGMMSIDFYDSEGNYLQLATGVTAEILMDLTQLSINNQALTVGDTIPLWHFDEDQGLWIEDGTGVVVASDTSVTGMAISATVTHFSIWNWDLKWQNGGSVDVFCQLFDGTATTCNVVANVTLDDGSHFTRSHTVPLEGLHVINMPTSATIDWRATTPAGLMGTQTSGTSGDVIITIEEPKTDNFVQCDINGTAVACEVTLENPYDDDVIYSVPASGATIQTLIDGVSSLSWSATTGKISEGGMFVSYSGTAVSGISGAVAIHLDNRVESVAPQKVRIRCINGDDVNVSACDIGIYIRDLMQYHSFSRVAVGTSVVFTFPDGMNPDSIVEFNANTPSETYAVIWNPPMVPSYAFGYVTYQYGSLIDNQLIDIELHMNDAGEIPDYNEIY
ncbi:astroprincin family protein [Sulfurimonas sp.]|uniref:astroprincin family protein n=1 Tax=Sulfurimonas sp. TaxID=2022749 RepID=UPI003D11CB81